MKIYTTYYANIKNLPINIIPIRVSLYQPKSLNMRYSYPKLYPTKELLNKYKTDHIPYSSAYEDKVLSILDADQVVADMKRICEKENAVGVALVCYESPDKFCHRHIVREWLNQNGHECNEYA